MQIFDACSKLCFFPLNFHRMGVFGRTFSGKKFSDKNKIFQQFSESAELGELLFPPASSHCCVATCLMIGLKYVV